TFQIIHYINQSGIIQLAVQKVRSSHRSAATFYRYAEAVEALENLCEKFKLCPRFCSLQQGVTSCSHYRIHSCEGICEEKETVAEYNSKVEEALRSFNNKQNSFVIHGKGRTKDEIGFALILQGMYQGFGFFEKDIS